MDVVLLVGGIPRLTLPTLELCWNFHTRTEVFEAERQETRWAYWAAGGRAEGGCTRRQDNVSVKENPSS